MLTPSRSTNLGCCEVGFTKPPKKDIGINSSTASFILARPCRTTRKHGDHSHCGVHGKLPTADTLLTTIEMTTMMAVTMTETTTETAAMENHKDANNPPHHQDEHPPTRAANKWPAPS